MAKNYHAVKHGGKWAVEGEGNSRASSVHSTQAEAWGATKDLARRNSGEAFLHGENGRIRERNTYGHDPYPPKG